MLSRVALAILSVLFLTSPALARSSPSLASQAQGFPAPPVRAWAAVAIDGDTRQVLASVNPHAHLAIASTTKVMTAVLALQLGSLTDVIKVPKAAFNYEWDATVMGLKPGEKVTLRDLLYGLMLPSGADAANTIAIHYGGSEAKFVALMNARALQLGMRDTHYGTAHGLDVAGQYSSAYDLAILGAYASTIPSLMQIASTRRYTWNGHTWDNLNHVINWYPGADGIKPGFTDLAGMTQLLDARRHGRHVVVAILHTPDMVIDARNLLNFGLRDFTWAQTTLPGDGPALIQSGADASGPWGYFPASGHYVRGKFWQAFKADGQLSTLGYPRTEPLHTGSTRIQYFQNGALAQRGSGPVSRVQIGLTPLPGVRPTPTPTPTPRTTATVPARESTIVVRPTATRTAHGTPTVTPVARRTPTPTPVPRRSPTPTPTTGPSVDRVFAAFQRAHAALLGPPAAQSWRAAGYVVQLFRYGGLAYDSRARATWLLPMGDRLLAARHYLPKYPGNVYPKGFAPVSLLKAIHWM
jgi:D-alanyl-D-alanine carboxypeptidase (penicillin-binding protein 5/6)